MNFIKNNWLLLLVLVVIIYFAYRYYKRTKTEEEKLSAIGSAIPLANAIKSDGNITIATPVTFTPVMNIDSKSWKIGDKIYGGATGVNTYSSPTSGANSVVKFYAKDSYVGTYLGNESGYAKIIVQEPSNSLLEAFGYENNAVRFVLINQVYSK